jgi:hypothetical protein
MTNDTSPDTARHVGVSPVSALSSSNIAKNTTAQTIVTVRLILISLSLCMKPQTSGVIHLHHNLIRREPMLIQTSPAPPHRPTARDAAVGNLGGLEADGAFHDPCFISGHDSRNRFIK